MAPSTHCKSMRMLLVLLVCCKLGVSHSLRIKTCDELTVVSYGGKIGGGMTGVSDDFNTPQQTRTEASPTTKMGGDEVHTGSCVRSSSSSPTLTSSPSLGTASQDSHPDSDGPGGVKGDGYGSGGAHVMADGTTETVECMNGVGPSATSTPSAFPIPSPTASAEMSRKMRWHPIAHVKTRHPLGSIRLHGRAVREHYSLENNYLGFRGMVPDAIDEKGVTDVEVDIPFVLTDPGFHGEIRCNGTLAIKCAGAPEIPEVHDIIRVIIIGYPGMEMLPSYQIPLILANLMLALDEGSKDAVRVANLETAEGARGQSTMSFDVVINTSKDMSPTRHEAIVYVSSPVANDEGYWKQMLSQLILSRTKFPMTWAETLTCGGNLRFDLPATYDAYRE